MFLDASAVVAIIAREPDEISLLGKIGASESLYSPLTLFESALALARKSDSDIGEARQAALEFFAATGAAPVPIDGEVADEALLAFARFGKGRHRAALNMGDCFSYACAKIHGVPLLCKGDDFRHTDARLA